ncbi:diacylglycerol/lipid kinase family protein [Streptomyces peucetius]|uniref:Diacylglycerol kinase family protein n=1 Tax=Streptomyces peucetius TaxID=1950 RepID=A0ABY6HZQ7_STRPE|nr:diacylglycerol kinase family protein [Streptomyces peucetius]UYQ60066.1 diacylglycerol kinase family protein [Streptomyces peucetius]
MSHAKAPLVVVVNPRATKSSPTRTRAVIDALATTHQVTLLDTSGAHLRDLGAFCRSVGARAVAVMGGDGTLNHACSALLGLPVTVVVIPTGAGNLLARSLRIPNDPLRAVGLLQRPQPRIVDVPVAAVRLAGSPDRIAITQVGLGREAQVVAWADRRRHLPTALRLVVAAVATGGRRKPRFTVRSEDQPETVATSASVQLRYPYTRLGPLPVGIRADSGALAMMLLRPGTRPVTRHFGSADIAFSAVEEQFSVHVDGEPVAPAWSAAVVPAAHRMLFLAGENGFLTGA